MVTIQLTDGNLDVGSEQAMELEVTAMRFSQGIRDAYTNDIDLPKTRNNIRLLECYNLLDSPNQLYGNQIKPAILTVDGYMLDVHLQVVSVTDDTITVCMYEQVLPNDLRDKEIRELVRDDQNSITAWNGTSMNLYPDRYWEYDYGTSYQTIGPQNPFPLSPGETFSAHPSALAQMHQFRDVNDVLADISSVSGHTMPTVDVGLVLLSQNKYVCPENRRQTISVQLSSDGGQDMCIVGGQHVTNSLEGFTSSMERYGDSQTKEVTFNRPCSGTFMGFLSWGRKMTAGTNTFQVTMLRNGVPETSWSFSTSGTGQRNGFVVAANYPVAFAANDILSFRFDSQTTNNPQNKMELVQMVFDFTWTDYEITEDDYGQDMVYGGIPPILFAWGPDDTLQHKDFDGMSGPMNIYKWNGQVDQTLQMTLPLASWSWHGFWCNLSDITVGQLLWGLAWLSGSYVRRTQTGIEFGTAERMKSIDGNVSEIRPDTEHLGRLNYIRWSGQENTVPTSEIDNEFLEAEHDIAVLPFANVRPGRMGIAYVPQYKVEPDSDGGFSIDFSEIEGQVLLRKWNPTAPNPVHVLMPPPLAPTFGFENLTSATEVDIETFDDQVTDLDYVYLDGRKYMIISVSSDLNDRFSKITALLVPTKSPLSTPITWQLQRQ